MKASRFVLASVGALGLSWILLVALSGKETRAQAKPDAPPTSPAAPPEPSLDDLPPVAPPPAEPESLALPDEPQPATPAQAENIRQHALRRSGTRQSSKPVVAPSPPVSTVDGDPEKAAQEFVQKNQKIAETELASLTKEAEALRSRLQKVESAIRRWESVSHALKQSEGVASRADGSWKAEASSRRGNIDFNSSSLPSEELPTSLEPIARPTPNEKVDPSADTPLPTPTPTPIESPASKPKS